MSSSPTPGTDGHAPGVPTELYSSFTNSVRELADATLRSNADAETLARAEALVREVTATLTADQIPGTHGESCPQGGLVGSWGNTVVGLRNPVAIPLVFAYETDRVWAEFTPGALFEGPPGHMHGGVIAMFLDQVLGELAVHLNRPGLTANLSVDYLKPTKLNTVLRIEAWVERTEGFKTWTTGTVSTADGTVCAKGTGLFILPRFLREKSLAEITEAQQHDATTS
ncbi:PaaI family thioesterase [Nocardioides yefusunii]|uniref:Acyl-coenzyme A thioesterase THEM4 n=1 Tax=Nocardioides yefusunii TaxID=2500546 RepID=A0ABW1QTY4_9ACTN|nr:PaaI family thioesterase [Nocardioides yefusunii]